MTDAPIPIRLIGCAKTYDGGVRALEPLDLEVAGGETIVLLGPSGCGKTTTLRMIAGLETPDPGGRVLFGAEDVTRLPIEKRRVGMVFQSYALFPNLTVAGNVDYGLKVRRLPRAERQARVAEMLAMMRIEALADRRIDQLSGGQRQRVALARAVAVRPRVLLLDEPLTALDAKLRDTVRAELDELLRRLHITAIYVTHDQGEAMALGDRVVVMNQGRVAQVGRPRDIYFRPADRFVADFIGSMNRLPRAFAPEGAPAGGDLLFRPEDGLLGPAGGRGLSVRVAAAQFLGAITRVSLVGPEGLPFLVDAAGRADYAPGMEATLVLDPDRLISLAS